MHLINFISTCKSFDNPGVGQNAIRLCLFPLSLSGEATLCFNGLTPDSITNWKQLRDAFLKRFFPPSKRAQLRDKISKFRQLPTEALHETWERFKTKLMRCPNHHMTNVHLMDILYKALNSITKPVVDNAAGASFMDLTFGQASNMLDRMTKQSRAWHTRDSEVASPTISMGKTAEQRRREEKRGFRGNTQGNQGRNYYDNSGNKDQGSWKNNNDKSGLYVPPGRHDATTSSSGSIEDMMAKLLKGVEATSAGVTEVINDLSSMKQLVDSHSTSIKKIEQQLSQLSAALNQRKTGTLPSNTVQNPRNDGSCMAITTRSGKVLETSSKGKQVVDEVADIDDNAKGEEFAEATHDVHDVTPSMLQPEKAEKRKQEEKKVVERTIPYPPPPFPQRLKKVADDTKFSKFMTMLKQLTINVPLVEALEQMPGYAKFMKDLLTKKRAASYELKDVIHHCSAIATRSLVQKKADPGAFTIPCTIGSMNIAKALCDLGASINLMPLSVYRKLGLGDPIPTNMRLVMADRLVDSEVPIILGRPFLAIGSVLIDMRANELLFWLNDEVVRFDICKPMKQPSDMDVLSVAYEDNKALSVEKSLIVDSLSDMLLNFERDEADEHKETACALTGTKSYSHVPKKLDLDLTNQPSQTAKTSIVEPPMLELKDLPNYLWYTFLGYRNTLPESVEDDLSEQHVEALISTLMRYKRAMGRKIDDIIGISSEPSRFILFSATVSRFGVTKRPVPSTMDLSTKSRVLIVVKVPKKLIKWWGPFNYSEKHKVRKVLGNLVALIDITPRPDLIEAALTFWDPNTLVFRFGSCELMPTLAEVSHLFLLTYMGQQMILAPNHTRKKFLRLCGLKDNKHLGCLKQSWISLDYFFARFGSLEGFDCFWDEFCTTKKIWEQYRLEVFCLALLGILVFPLDERCINTRLESVVIALFKNKNEVTIVPMILTEIYKSLTEAKGGVRFFEGSNLILQLWMMEHLHTLSLIREDVIDRCLNDRVQAMLERMCFDKFSFPIGVNS
ncbi:hypothetical protein CQW23_18828 [Capsicum baccatum]|uniref:Retrotransposon gag domain-containing protein n=1 Tax=Capsicum baccatum TaxID=33114 RepID=A0A2G2W419_CAPBA|nr:hypothetical protein CQW23_18828 [Capsicum baccatum]